MKNSNFCKFFFFFFVSLLIINKGESQVLISTDSGSPEASAMLEIYSKSKGLLIPRMSSVEIGNITDPAEGLLVYDLTLNSFFLRGSTDWVNLSSSAEIWLQNTTDVYLNDLSKNVGIGTLTPEAKLSVVSNAVPGPESILKLTISDDSESYMNFRNGTTSDMKYMPSIFSHNGTDHRQSFYLIGSTTDLLDDDAAFPIINFDARRESSEIINRPLFAWSNYGNMKMTLNAEGNLGIGTVTPLAKLHINPGVLLLQRMGSTTWISDKHDPYIYTTHSGGIYPFESTVGNLIIQPRTTSLSDIILATGNGTPSAVMVIKGEGNVGIGTTDPTQRLDVNGNIQLTGGDRTVYLESGYLGIKPYDDTYGLILRDFTGNSDIWSSFKTVDAAIDYLHITMNSISLTEGLSVSDNGNVGIGVTDPDAKLEINGQIKITGGTPGENKVLTCDADGLASWQESVSEAYIDHKIDMLSIANNGVTDYDGNHYNAIVIGNQIWMAEDLRVTHYPDGSLIPNITDNTTWGNLGDNNTDDAYCFYNNNSGTDYGALYTYAAAIGDNWVRDNNDGQGVCPDGWHLPTDSDWTELTDYLGGVSIAGSKLKEIGTTHWYSPNTGATNESGFTAFGGGYRQSSDGVIASFRYRGDWWSATEFNATNVWGRWLMYNEVNVLRFNFQKSSGYSVRCLRD